MTEANTNKNGQFFMQNMNIQRNSGLLRYRSAPSSFLASEAEKNEIWPSRFSSDEANRVCGLQNHGCSSHGNGDMNSQFPSQYLWQSVAHLSSMISSAELDSQPTNGNGYGTRKWIGRYGNVNTANEESTPSASQLKNQVSTSSSMSASSNMISQIAETETENSRTSCLQDHERAKTSSDQNTFYNSEFSYSSWNDPSNLSEHFTCGVKREVNGDWNLRFHNQQVENGNRPHTLSHHLSLPKISPKMPAQAKFTPVEDTVACKTRAKRGCATHPRSIAERVRRTRISERIRKLQELLPNIDKQTNTADMLDLAVEHIKNLQKQYEKLCDHRAQCKCLPFQRIP